MQQLHLVGVTTDHTGLILSARRGAKTGKFTVAADDELVAAVQEAKRLREGGEERPAGAEGEGGSTPAAQPVALPAPAPPPPPPKPVSSLSPREIQARLRAGGTVGEIAAAAGVDDEWILRFADPIRAEQARVVERAQALTFNKPRLGVSAEPLATSVQLNLAERGVRLPADVFATAWTAFNLHGTSWAVLFSYTSRQRRQTAQWEVDLRSGDLVARNRLASDLAYLEPGRRRRRLEELPPPAPPSVDEARAGRRAAAARKSRKAAKAPAGRATATEKSATVGTKAAPAKRSAVGSKATPAKRSAVGTKVAPAKKLGGSSKVAPAKRSAVGSKATPAEKSPTAAKAVPAKKLAGSSKAAPAKRSAVGSKATPAKRSAVGTKVAPAKKGNGRQSSPRARRPAKKPPAERPSAPQATAPPPEAPALPERPTHLARPPSPMNPSNRSVTLPGRLVGAPSLRPTLPPPRARPKPPAARPGPRPGSAGVGDHEPPQPPPRPPQPEPQRDTPEFVLSPSPEPTAVRRTDAAGAGSGTPQPAGDDRPRGRRRRSERRISPKVGDQPAVVILSTPAVRRLESVDDRQPKAPPRRS